MSNINKTIIIFDQCGESPLSFAIVEGDKTHLKGVFVNTYVSKDEENRDAKLKLQEELNDTFYDNNGERIIELHDDFPAQLGPDIAAGTCAVIVAGFLP